MKIAVLGSTGFVGKVIIQKLIDANYDVKVLVRNPEKLGNLLSRVEFIKGDYFDPKKLKKTLQGTEAVISTIGAPAKNPNDQDNYIKAMQCLINIMYDLSIKRIIYIGGAATPNSEKERFDSKRKILRFLVNSMGSHLIKIKDAECQILMKSDLDWTIVRPPRIVTGESKRSIYIYESRLRSLKIKVGNLADFMIEQINSKAWIRKTPVVSL